MNQLQIRMATEKDFDDLVNLWKYCFTDSDDFRKWYFEHYYRQEETLVAEADGRTVASLQVIDLPINMKGKLLKTGYIVGVDCLPEYRGRGLTRQLMEEAIEHYAPLKGMQLLQLMPFEADFYYPFGFTFGNYHANMIVDIDEFYYPEHRKIARQYSWKDIDLVNPGDDLAIIEATYEKCMKCYDGYVERRSNRRWAAILDDVHIENGFMKLLYNTEGETVGYLIYSFMDGKLYIREGLAQDDNARKAMYYFISVHRSQYKTVEWSASEKEPIIYRRKKDKSSIQVYPFMMYCIIDPTVISMFASKYPEEDLYFFIEEKGTYVWRAQNGLIEKTADTCEADLILTLKALTQVVFDYTIWDISQEDGASQKFLKPMVELFKEKKYIFNNEYF